MSNVDQASPIAFRILLIVLGPPVMALMISFLSRGWAAILQRGKVSDATRKRQGMEFWVALVAGYLIVLMIIGPGLI